MVLDNIFLLQLHPFVAIALVTVVITFCVTVLYKFTTDQKRLKQLKEDQKKMQDEYKKHMNNPKKAMEINKKLMSTNFEYMKHSFKSTLYTFIPLIIIFAWMNSHLGYEQLYVNEKFTITAEFQDAAEGSITIGTPDGLQIISNATKPVANKVVWQLEGKKAGNYTINYTYGDEYYQQNVMITNEWHYDPNNVLDQSRGQPPIQKNSMLKKITIDLQSTKPMKGRPVLGILNWLWTYILLSLLSSIGFRKLFGVY